jgi:uncharacterized protein (TIGR03083 family)
VRDVDHDARVDAVEQELAALVAAVAAAPADARVPTCPDFTLDELAKHVGDFSGFWTHVLCEGTGRPKPPFDDRVDPVGRVAWLDAIAGHLVTELRATPPDTHVWTWYEPDPSAAFVARRCSHELSIHRVDAQLADGAADPVDAALAADGIEEIFVLLERNRADDRRDAARSGQRLHLHGTDHDPAEWLITLDPEGVHVEREHAKGDLAVRGRVSDLEMLLYQRPTLDAVERVGDSSVLDAFHRQFTFD